MYVNLYVNSRSKRELLRVRVRKRPWRTVGPCNPIVYCSEARQGDPNELVYGLPSRLGDDGTTSGCLALESMVSQDVIFLEYLPKYPSIFSQYGMEYIEE